MDGSEHAMTGRPGTFQLDVRLSGVLSRPGGGPADDLRGLPSGAKDGFFPLSAMVLHSFSLFWGRIAPSAIFQASAGPGGGVLAGVCSEPIEVSIDSLPSVPPIAARQTFLFAFSATAELRCPASELFMALLPAVAIPVLVVPPRFVAGQALDIFVAQARALVDHELSQSLAMVCERNLLALLSFATAAPSAHFAMKSEKNRDALYRNILVDISVHCSRHDFGPESLAKRHNIHLRSLQKLFQERGTTLKEQLTLARLKFAHAALFDPANAEKNVSDIAFEAGFNDISTFNRIFRKTFGCTPTSWRKATQA